MILKGEASSSCFWSLIASVVDTGDKFTTGVVDTDDKSLTINNYEKVHTNSKLLLQINQGLGRNTETQKGLLLAGSCSVGKVFPVRGQLWERHFICW